MVYMSQRKALLIPSNRTLNIIVHYDIVLLFQDLLGNFHTCNVALMSVCVVAIDNNALD